jgi:hypothetical protein
MTVDEKENCILYALCNAAPHFSPCVSHQSPLKINRIIQMMGLGEGRRGVERERQMSEGCFINHLVIEVETAC